MKLTVITLVASIILSSCATAITTPTATEKPSKVRITKALLDSLERTDPASFKALSYERSKKRANVKHDARFFLYGCFFAVGVIYVLFPNER